MPKLKDLSKTQLVKLEEYYKIQLKKDKNSTVNWQKLTAVAKELSKRNNANSTHTKLPEEKQKQTNPIPTSEETMSFTHTLQLQAINSFNTQAKPLNLILYLAAGLVATIVCGLLIFLAYVNNRNQNNQHGPKHNIISIVPYPGKNSTPKSILYPEDFIPIATITSNDTILFNCGDGQNQPTVTINQSKKKGILYTYDNHTVAVFCFNNVILTSTVTFTGKIPIVILSRNDIEVNTTLNLDGTSAKNIKHLSLPGIGICGGADGSNHKIKHNNGKGLGAGLFSQYGGSGAGYGGIGGNGTISQQPVGSTRTPNTFKGSNGGKTYGNSQISILYGGSSGGTSVLGSSGAGGGAIELSATNNININSNALISCNGGYNSRYRGGTGSGGSIILRAKTIKINGNICSKGGAGSRGAGGSGGGRIALYFENRYIGKTLTLENNVKGGPGLLSYSNAKPGTIWYSFLAHWAFDKQQNSKSQTIIPDLTGLNNHLKFYPINKKITFIDGKHDQAISLNGKTEYLELNQPFMNQLGKENFTISFWIKTKKLAEQSIIFNKGRTTPPNSISFDQPNFQQQPRFFLIKYPGRITFSVEYKNKQLKINAPANQIENEQWQHIAIIKNHKKQTLSIYINANLQDQIHDSILNISNTRNLLIGCCEEQNKIQFSKMAIDEFRIYNFPLSLPDLKSLALQDSNHKTAPIKINKNNHSFSEKIPKS